MAKVNVLKRTEKYFREVRAEFKKVVWPTFKQLRNKTLVVIVAVLLVGAVIGFLDMIFGWGLKQLINLGGATGATVGFLGL